MTRAPLNLDTLRRAGSGRAFELALEALARGGRAHPRAWLHNRQVRLLRDVPYGPARPWHLLDVYTARAAATAAPRPVVLYLHGGAFRILSKDTHWMMAASYARLGYVVFNANYRLAPRHPYPAAAEDAARALAWVSDHATSFGGDPSRIVVAGESAGANLATALAVACCYERPEPWAVALRQRGIRPRAVVAACGILQVSDALRVLEGRRTSRWLRERVEEVERVYFPADHPARTGATIALADPLLVLERERPIHPLPPFFALVGTRDPLLGDSRRLREAIRRWGGQCELRVDGGALHAYHAHYWHPRARRAWTHQAEALATWLDTPLADASSGAR